MEIRRFYIENKDIHGNIATISGDEFTHMTKVLRHKIGYSVILCNNEDNIDYMSTIVEIGKDFALARIDSKEPNNTATAREVIFCIALPKGDKIDFIVQKAVELGVSGIIVFDSENVSEDKFNLERLERITKEACKQCGRAKLATIRGALSYDEMLGEIKGKYAVMAYEHEKINTFGNLDFTCDHAIAVIVGSEGGFTPEEVAKAKENGVISITLGSRILRCETASLVALSLAMFALGELG